MDEATRYCWIYCIPNKRSSTILEKFKALAENQAETTIKLLRVDQGTEYDGKDTMTLFLTENGIQKLTSAAYSSSSNGLAERLNRTLQDMIRPMIIGSNTPPAFWSYAAYMAAYIRNRLPTRSLPQRYMNTPQNTSFDISKELTHSQLRIILSHTPKIHHLQLAKLLDLLTHPMHQILMTENLLRAISTFSTADLSLGIPANNEL